MAGNGFWRWHYRVEESTTGTDSLGQQTNSWAYICSVRGSAVGQQREVMDDLGAAVRTDLSIECAYHPRIHARCRFIDSVTGRIFNLSSVVDPDGGKCRRLRVAATEQVA